MNTSRTVHASPRVRSSGFTLIELLVAVSVLAILCSLVLQLMSSTTKLTGNSRQATDCDTEARYALNQIAADLTHRIRRQDVDSFVNKKAGDDRLYFFAETPGYAPELDPAQRSNISLVGYRLLQRERNFTLQRYARALPWITDGANVAMPYVLMDATTNMSVGATTLVGAFPKIDSDDASEDDFYQTIGENIVRFEVSLIQKPTTSGLTSAPAVMLADGKKIEEELPNYGLTRISAVVITLAIIDPQNMARLGPEPIKAFVSSEIFDTQPPDSGSGSGLKLPLEAWNHEFVSQMATLPKPLSLGLRFYQRVINL